MTTTLTKADALGLYHTSSEASAGVEGEAQLLSGNSLGGERSGTEVTQYLPLMSNPIAPVIIEHISGKNASGAGVITGTGSTLQWTPNGGTADTAVTVTSGSTVVLEEDTDANSFIRVTRDAAYTEDLDGDMTLDLRNVYNNVIGMDDITDAEQTSGLNTYRAIIFRNHSDSTLTSVRFWINDLGTTTTVSSGLGGSGSGTITGTSFADWPQHGWAHIYISTGSTTREIVYYTSRTDTVLTVPAAGRGLLGTSAAAGSTDNIYSVPGIRIGLETHSSDAIQSIANETTAPSGITWDTGRTSATGRELASLGTAINHGLWIHRATPVNIQPGDTRVQNSINFSFIYSATTYTGLLDGYYRVADDAVDLFEVFLGSGAEPDFTAAADATSATLPFTAALAAPGSGTRTYHYTTLDRNAYNVTSLNRYSRTTTIDSAGAVVAASPTSPRDEALTNLGGGKVLVQANYDDANDRFKGDEFRVYFRGDGTNPNVATDTPTTIQFIDSAMPTGNKLIASVQGPFADTVPLKAIFRTYDITNSNESANTNVISLTINSKTPLAKQRLFSFGTGFGGEMDSPAQETVFIDEANNVRFEVNPGFTELYAGSSGTTLVWRMKYDSGDPISNGIWTTFGFLQEAISGSPTGTGDPVEFVDVNTLYILVNGTRRMKIDVSASTISCAAIFAQSDTMRTSGLTAPVADHTFHSVFQVRDRITLASTTVGTVDESGQLNRIIPWAQEQTTGAFL